MSCSENMAPIFWGTKRAITCTFKKNLNYFKVSSSLGATARFWKWTGSEMGRLLLLNSFFPFCVHKVFCFLSFFLISCARSRLVRQFSFTVPGAATVAVSLGAAGEFMSLAFSFRSPSSSSSSKSPPSELTTRPSSSSQDRRGEDIISRSLDPSLYSKRAYSCPIMGYLFNIQIGTEKSGGRFGIFYTRQSNKDGRPLIFIF